MFFLKYPKNTTITIGNDWIKITGNKGTLLKKKKKTSLLINNNNMLYLLNRSKKYTNLLHKLNTLIKGVSIGFIIKLHLIGTGYKIDIKNSTLFINVGFSHPILYELPSNIIFKQPKNNLPVYLLSGLEYHKLTRIASDIRNWKKPEPYKGKGIRYYNQFIIQKEGKKNNV